MTELKKLGFSTRWLWIGLAAVYAGIFATILVFAYQGKLPSFLTQNDKPAHLILYAIASFIGHRALNRRQVTLAKRALPLFPLLFTLFTIAEELMQSFSPNRSLDAGDLLASMIGIGLGYWLAERGQR